VQSALSSRLRTFVRVQEAYGSYGADTMHMSVAHGVGMDEGGATGSAAGGADTSEGGTGSSAAGGLDMSEDA
jgi:hypothetical protein